MQNYDLLAAIDNMPSVLRPANYPARTPGEGFVIVEAGGARVLVLSLLGRVHMDPPLSSPFEAASRVLSQNRGKYDVAVVDLHAEATGEKLALGHYLDGRVAAVVGTHTHVPTADLTVLPRGTGYVTDLGMCGAEGSILGIDSREIVERYLTAINHKLHVGRGKMRAEGVLFTVDPALGRCTAAERVTI
jgi:metallophosphoesterase (TIGR00282 family)